MKNAESLAQAWAGQVAAGMEDAETRPTREAFESANGWSSRAGVAFLYHRRSVFGTSDRRRIEKAYRDLNQPGLEKYTSVDHAPFTLGDLTKNALLSNA